MSYRGALIENQVDKIMQNQITIGFTQGLYKGTQGPRLLTTSTSSPCGVSYTMVVQSRTMMLTIMKKRVYSDVEFSHRLLGIPEVENS